MPRATLPGLLLVGIALFCAAKALPQGETTSAIAGQVTDATSAAIPGALVTITNRETGLQRRATADEQRRFNFPQLKPGAYSVKAEAEGFDPQQNDNVISGLGQKQTVQSSNAALPACASIPGHVTSSPTRLLPTSRLRYSSFAKLSRPSDPAA